jgi:biopolymer transport protein ExbD
MAIDFDKAQAKRGDEDPLMSQINTTPLVDVMLVLLIIFLITIPVVNTSVLVKLPQEVNRVQEVQPDNIIISVDAEGGIYWFNTKLPTREALLGSLRQAAALDPQPEVHIRGDARADYDAIGRVVVACQQAGIARVGFITEPPARD